MSMAAGKLDISVVLCTHNRADLLPAARRRNAEAFGHEANIRLLAGDAAERVREWRP
jgi:hypothetical protein